MWVTSFELPKSEKDEVKKLEGPLVRLLVSYLALVLMAILKSLLKVMLLLSMLMVMVPPMMVTTTGSTIVTRF